MIHQDMESMTRLKYQVHDLWPTTQLTVLQLVLHEQANLVARLAQCSTIIVHSTPT